MTDESQCLRCASAAVPAAGRAAAAVLACSRAPLAQLSEGSRRQAPLITCRWKVRKRDRKAAEVEF